MDKDYEHMTPEERKNDPEWLKMTPVERMYALGMMYAYDGEKITLEEYRNGMSDERRERNTQILRERQAERDKVRKKYLEEYEQKLKQK